MLTVGLIGVGGISGAHIPAWDGMEDAKLVALCDIRPEQMEKYPDKHHYELWIFWISACPPICMPSTPKRRCSGAYTCCVKSRYP